MISLLHTYMGQSDKRNCNFKYINITLSSRWTMYKKTTKQPKIEKNAIDKFKLKIFVPVFVFIKRFEVCFVMVLVNKFVKYFIFHLCWQGVNVDMIYSNSATKNCRHKSKGFVCNFYGTVHHPKFLRPESYRSAAPLKWRSLNKYNFFDHRKVK